MDSLSKVKCLLTDLEWSILSMKLGLEDESMTFVSIGKFLKMQTRKVSDIYHQAKHRLFCRDRGEIARNCGNALIIYAVFETFIHVPECYNSHEFTKSVLKKDDLILIA